MLFTQPYQEETIHAGSAETGARLEYKKDHSALMRLPLRKNNIDRAKAQIGNNMCGFCFLFFLHFFPPLPSFLVLGLERKVSVLPN